MKDEQESQYYYSDPNKELASAKGDKFAILNLNLKNVEYKNVRPLLAELLNFYPDIKHRQDKKPVDLIIKYEP